MSAYLDYGQIGDLLQIVREAGGQIPQEAFLETDGDAPDTYAAAVKWRDALAWDISWAYTVHQAYIDWTSDSRSRRRTERLVEIRAGAEKLASTLRDETLGITPYLEQRWVDEIPLSEVARLLELLSVAARTEVSWLSEGGLADTAPLSKAAGLAPYPTEGIGFVDRMVKAYERALGIKALVQYDSTREPVGPFIAFVFGAQSAIEISGTRSAIANTPGAIDQAYKRWRRWSDNRQE